MSIQSESRNEDDKDDPFAEEHQYNAPKTSGYRKAPDVSAGYKSKTRWQGFGRAHYLCEPASVFMPRNTQCYVNFLKHRKTDLNVTDVCVPKKA